MVENDVYDIALVMKCRYAHYTPETTENFSKEEVTELEKQRGEDELHLQQERQHILNMLNMHYQRLDAMYFAAANAKVVHASQGKSGAEVESGLKVEHLLVSVDVTVVAE